MRRTRLVRDLCEIALCAAMTAVCAWITVPVFAVPITMQLFGVALTLLLLGGKRGTIAVAVYLLLGAVGLPVFSSFRGGIGVLVGATGGYLVGFLVLSLVYWLIDALTKNRGKSPVKRITALLAGLLFCYAFGTVQFALVTNRTDGDGVWSILISCVIPFLLPDLLKLILAERVATLIRKSGVMK